MEKEPYVGMVVHYVSRGSLDLKFPPELRAAMVTEIDVEALDSIGLCIINPQGLFFDRGVKYDETWKPGTWHYTSQEYAQESE